VLSNSFLIFRIDHNTTSTIEWNTTVFLAGRVVQSDFHWLYWWFIYMKKYYWENKKIYLRSTYTDGVSDYEKSFDKVNMQIRRQLWDLRFSQQWMFKSTWICSKYLNSFPSYSTNFYNGTNIMCKRNGWLKTRVWLVPDYIHGTIQWTL
jgi:hypothetical protein